MSTSLMPANTKRFARLVEQPGGTTLAEATAAADSNLDGIRSDALIEIDAILTRMYALGKELHAAPTMTVLDELYCRANNIVGVAGVFGQVHLGLVAYSLCELIDRLRLSGRFGGAAVQVHLDFLRLMHTAPPDDPRKTVAMRRALQSIVDSIPSERAG